MPPPQKRHLNCLKIRATIKGRLLGSSRGRLDTANQLYLLKCLTILFVNMKTQVHAVSQATMTRHRNEEQEQAPYLYRYAASAIYF